jgi:hypothetical protein
VPLYVSSKNLKEGIGWYKQANIPSSLPTLSYYVYSRGEVLCMHTLQASNKQEGRQASILSARPFLLRRLQAADTYNFRHTQKAWGIRLRLFRYLSVVSTSSLLAYPVP